MSAAAPVITVDGPSGVGKGTLCMGLARRLGWHLLDSGALYRVLAHAALSRRMALDDADALCELAHKLDLEFQPRPGADGQHEVHVLLDGVDVSAAIRTETSGNAASQVAALGPVRQALLERQREFRVAPGLVADGRDMGTVVFADAELKIFLTASPESRAERRYKQLKQKGLNVNLSDLIAEQQERDARDSTRAVSPLRAAADAVRIDTTALGVEAVLAEVLRRWPPGLGPN